MNVSERLVEFITDGATSNAIARHIVKLSMLDWAAVACAGKDEPVARIVRELAASEGGRPEATAIGLRDKVPARAAALVNGVASHALDYDDTHFASVGHPSAVVFPVVLALADRNGCNVAEVHDAALIGLETAVRVGAWLGRKHYRAGFHATSTSGTFGAVAAAARLLDLSQPQTGNALGLAASRASGVKEQFGTMGKPYHAGMAAAAGIEVALLAERGLEAADDGLAGVQGYSVTHHGEEDLTALEGLGETWMFQDVRHKFYACCHGTHAMLEALSQIVLDSPQSIHTIEVITHPQYLNVCNIEVPATALEAKFSYKQTAAMAVYGIDTAKPDTKACVCIKSDDGKVLESEYDLLELKNPEERERRVKSKAMSLLGKQAAVRLWESCRNDSSSGEALAWRLLSECER